MEEISSGGRGAWLHWDRGWALWGLLFTSCIPRSQSLPAFKDREKTADGGVGKQQLCPRTAQRATPPLRAAPSSSLPPKPPQRPTWQRASMQPYGRAESTDQSTTHPDKGVKSQKGGGGASLGAAGTPRPNAAPTASPHSQESHRMDFPSSAPSPWMGTHHCRALGTAGERTRKWGCHGNQRTASTDFIYLFIWLFAYFCQDWGGKKKDGGVGEKGSITAGMDGGWMGEWRGGGVERWVEGWMDDRLGDEWRDE